MKKLNRYNWADVIIVTFLTLFGIAVFYPFYNTLLVSLVSQQTYIKTPFMLFPKEIDLSSYVFVFTSPLLVRGLMTTAILFFLGTAYNMFLTVTMSYALIKPIPGNKFFLYGIILTMYIGGGLIPSYLLVQQLGLINNIGSMIFPYIASVPYILIMMRFFKALPIELEESAKLDGANEITILFKIILPLSLPILATISLYYGVERWNEWYSGMLYIKSTTKMPLQTVLRNIVQDASKIAVDVPDVAKAEVFADGIKMATIMVVMIPIMCVYPFLQKYFVTGLTAGAVKS